MAYPLIPSAYLMEEAANGASDTIDTQPNLLQYLQVYLNGGTNPAGYFYKGFFPLMNSQLYGGDWSVVWGPCVYCEENALTVTNAMYVAYSPSRKTYMVGAAATNPISYFDWLVEDYDVVPSLMAAWPPTLPFVSAWRFPPIPTTVAAISAGTATGISDLLTRAEMIDPNGGNLQTFLNSKVNSSATLIFGGHSLAGALVPTLAFYLYPQPASSGWANIFVLPVAGATPGNQAYAAEFAQAYPQTQDASSGFYWNADYANRHDIVPHAWDRLPLVVRPKNPAGNYPSIWGVLDGNGSGETVGSFVTNTMKLAELISDGYYTAITRLWVAPNWGYWNWTGTYPPTWTALPIYTDASPLATATQLFQAIEATHGDQYFYYFKVIPPPKMQGPMVAKKSSLWVDA